MRYIFAVHMSGGTNHGHIAEVRWKAPGSGEENKSSRASIAAWIDGDGDSRVQDRWGDVRVKVVRVSPPYLRTYADDRPTDNLLALPRY